MASRSLATVPTLLPVCRGIAMSLINWEHWHHSIRVIRKVTAKYGSHPAVWGFSPVNEVGAWTPMDVLRAFYWEAYGIVRKAAPKWICTLGCTPIPALTGPFSVVGRAETRREHLSGATAAKHRSSGWPSSEPPSEVATHVHEGSHGVVMLPSSHAKMHVSQESSVRSRHGFILS